MSVPLDVITRLSHAIAAEYDRRIEVLGVTSTDGGSDRVELLIAIDGRHAEPSRLLLNLNRAGVAELEGELRTKFREALQSHC